MKKIFLIAAVILLTSCDVKVDSIWTPHQKTNSNIEWPSNAQIKMVNYGIDVSISNDSANLYFKWNTNDYYAQRHLTKMGFKLEAIDETSKKVIEECYFHFENFDLSLYDESHKELTGAGKVYIKRTKGAIEENGSYEFSKNNVFSATSKVSLKMFNSDLPIYIRLTIPKMVDISAISSEDAIKGSYRARKSSASSKMNTDMYNTIISKIKINLKSEPIATKTP